MSNPSPFGTNGLWTDSVATSSGSRAQPSAATEGFDLKGVTYFHVFVLADSGQTLSGGGNMLGWLYDAELGLWCRSQDLDFAVSVSGTRCQVTSDFKEGAHWGRIVFQASSVTRSGGEITTKIRAEY